MSVLLQAVRFGASRAGAHAGLCAGRALTSPALLLRNACTCRSFGVRVIKPSPVLKACSPLLDHKDKSVRDGAKELAVRMQAPEFMPSPATALHCASLALTCPLLFVQVELTRWLGAAAVKRDFTDKMRDAQKKEVSIHRPGFPTGLAKLLLLVFPPRCRSKRRWKPSSPMFVPCPLATCAKTRSAPRPETLHRQTLSGLPTRRCALLYLHPCYKPSDYSPSVSQGTTSTAAATARSAPRVQSDVWDLMEPEDILTKLGKRDGEKAPFLQAASSEKWKGAQ